MDPAEVQRVCDTSGFVHGELPFRYLGVPISTKKLSSVDCEILVEKMVKRVRTWSTRNISFAGRRQLVNSVLLSIGVYWSHIFLLPKAVIKQVNAICRAFLWTCFCNSSKLGYVSWDEVCKPKAYGGLGFTNILLWNAAMVGKQAWNIALMTRERLKVIGASLTDHCGICGECRETHDHMFFECDYSKQCVVRIKDWLGIQATTRNFIKLFRWIQRRSRASKFRRMVMIASLEAAIYQIWQERNNSVWNMQI